MASEMMERLVRAARNASDEVLFRPPHRYFDSIVRAVLRELREPDEGMLAAMDGARDEAASIHCDNRAELTRSRQRPRLRAAIDHILNEEKTDAA